MTRNAFFPQIKKAGEKLFDFSQSGLALRWLKVSLQSSMHRSTTVELTAELISYKKITLKIMLLLVRTNLL